VEPRTAEVREDALRRLRLTRAPERRAALLVLDRREQAMDESTSELLQAARVPISRR
jgi:hypothetical protein